MDYSRLTFPPYSFVEFPKWIRVGEGVHLVQNAQEEAALVNASSETEPVATLEASVRRGRAPKAQS